MHIDSKVVGMLCRVAVYCTTAGVRMWSRSSLNATSLFTYQVRIDIRHHPSIKLRCCIFTSSSVSVNVIDARLMFEEEN